MKTLDREQPKPDITSLDHLTVEQQLQLAAASISGTIESKLTAMAVATLVSRMMQLDEQDQHDLWSVIQDMQTVKSREDAKDSLDTIMEILQPACKLAAPVSMEDLSQGRSREGYESWLVWISEKLKDLRSAKGMTQEQLATASGIPQSHISRLERGHHSPSRKTLEKLAGALGVDVGTLAID